MVVRAVLLDLDGTVFDHAGSARAGLRRWSAQLGAGWSEELAAAWSAAEARHLSAWREGSITFAEQRRRRLREVLPMMGRPVGGDADLDEVFTGYLAAYEGAWRGFDDVVPAVAAVRAAGLVTAVLTNGTEAQQRAKLARLGLVEQVGPVLTSEGIGVAKPDPRAFAAACARLGLAPAQVVSVGDDHDLDVVAARAAGLAAVHLDRTGAGPIGEVLRITTLADLAPVLASL